jgi:hypothetical protein
MSLARCAECTKEFDWEEAYNQQRTPGSYEFNPPGHGDFRPRAFCPHCGFLVAEWDIDRRSDRDRWKWYGKNAEVNAGRELPPQPLDLWGQPILPEDHAPVLEDHIDLDHVARHLEEIATEEDKEPEPGTETLTEERFKELRVALAGMDADAMRSQLNPSANELIALASALTRSHWHYRNMSLETLLTLLEGVGDTSAAKVIPHIAVTYNPNPGTQSVEAYYVPGASLLAHAVVELGCPPEVIDELLKESTARDVDWCNRLMIVGCLGELGEQRVLPVIEQWLSRSTPDEPLLDWVRNLLTRARMNLSRGGIVKKKEEKAVKMSFLRRLFGQKDSSQAEKPTETQVKTKRPLPAEMPEGEEQIKTVEQARAALRQANESYDGGDFHKAIALYDRLLQASATVLAQLPGANPYFIRENRAKAMCKVGRFDEAELELMRLVSHLQSRGVPTANSASTYWLLVARLKGDETRAMNEFMKL